MNPHLYILFLIGKSDINNELLESCCYDCFSTSIEFWYSRRITENKMSDLYFNKESNYPGENTSNN